MEEDEVNVEQENVAGGATTASTSQRRESTESLVTNQQTQQKPRRKRRQRASVSSEANQSITEGASDVSPQPADTRDEYNLSAVVEDVVEGGPKKDMSELPIATPLGLDQQQPSQEVANVYIQHALGFRPTQRQKYEQILKEQKELDAETNKPADDSLSSDTGLELGLALQKWFMTFALALQGFIAGFAVLHAISAVFLTSSIFPLVQFLDFFADSALPFHVGYYVALVLCLIAVLDRYDVSSNSGRVLWRALTLQSSGLSVLFYALALIFNLIPIRVDQRMDLYAHNATEWITETSSRQPQPTYVNQPWVSEELQVWRGLSIARATVLTLGWLMIAVRPGTDLQSKHLRQLADEFRKFFTIAANETQKTHEAHA